MKLTGKAKEDFEKWYIEVFNGTEIDHWSTLLLSEFNRHKDSLKWGVYVDFFDSVGIEFWVAPYFNHDLGVMNEWAGFYEKGLFTVAPLSTRTKARTAAIEKANEIYNSKWKQ